MAPGQVPSKKKFPGLVKKLFHKNRPPSSLPETTKQNPPPQPQTPPIPASPPHPTPPSIPQIPLAQDPSPFPPFPISYTLSSLLYYSSTGDTPAVLAHLNASVSPSVSDAKTGTTPLIYASRSGYLHIVELLVSRGGDVHDGDNLGRNPLHYASQNGHVDIVRFLLGQGAGVNRRDGLGRTALHRAVEGAVNGGMGGRRKGCEEVVWVLVEARANIGLRDRNGKTPFSGLAGRVGTDFEKKVERFLENERLKKIAPELVQKQENPDNVYPIRTKNRPPKRKEVPQPSIHSSPPKENSEPISSNTTIIASPKPIGETQTPPTTQPTPHQEIEKSYILSFVETLVSSYPDLPVSAQESLRLELIRVTTLAMNGEVPSFTTLSVPKITNQAGNTQTLPDLQKLPQRTTEEKESPVEIVNMEYQKTSLTSFFNDDELTGVHRQKLERPNDGKEKGKEKEREVVDGEWRHEAPGGGYRSAWSSYEAKTGMVDPMILRWD